MLLHGLRAHLVHTDARVGLTMEQAERAVEMLHASNHMTQCTRSHLCSFCLAWEAEELQATGNARLCHASPSAKPVAPKGSSQGAMGDGTTPTPSPLPGTKGLFGKADHVGTPPKQTGQFALMLSGQVEIDATNETSDGKSLYKDIDELTRALLNNDVRAQLGLKALGKGANAQVLTFSQASTLSETQVPKGRFSDVEADAGAAATERSDEKARVRLYAPPVALAQPVSPIRMQAPISTRELAIKIGTFPSKERFDREVEIQTLCAQHGVAPNVLSSSWDSAPGKYGIIVMERLTQPSYFRWMVWVSKDLCRTVKVLDANGPHRL